MDTSDGLGSELQNFKSVLELPRGMILFDVVICYLVVNISSDVCVYWR